MDVPSQFSYGRIVELKINYKKRFTPMFVPTISSTSKIGDFFNTELWLLNIKPLDFLISVYDYEENFQKLFPSLDSFVILDSGGYELRNIQNPRDWSLEGYINVINKIRPDIIISLDLPT